MPDPTPHPTGAPQPPPQHHPFADLPLPHPAPPARRLRVVVADDNPVVRAGLTALLSGRADIEVVAEAADGRQAYEAAHRHRPDVVLLDVRMPGVDGISALPYLVQIAPVVMLTYSRESEIVQEALRRGRAAIWSTASSRRTSWSTPYGTSRRAGPTSPRRRRAPSWPNSARTGPRLHRCRMAWASHRVRLHTEFPPPGSRIVRLNNQLHQPIPPCGSPPARLLIQKTFRRCNHMWDSLRLSGRVALRPLPTGRGSN